MGIDRNGNLISGRAYARKLAAVETHILKITVRMNMNSLANGLTITPERAANELQRRARPEPSAKSEMCEVAHARIANNSEIPNFPPRAE